MKGHINRIFAILLAFGLASCVSNYRITASFPPPLVDTIPVDAGLVLSETFQNYAFHEDAADRNEIIIRIGTAHSELFRVVTGQMFQTLDVEAPYENAQLLIEPEVDDFQYAIPRETRANIYEVWIKYRVQVKEADGSVIADWLINGYGKTPTAFLTSEGEALQAAITLALRDVGVQFAIGFNRQQPIQDWLQRDTGESSI